MSVNIFFYLKLAKTQAEKEFLANPKLMAKYEAREKELQAMKKEHEKAEKKKT